MCSSAVEVSLECRGLGVQQYLWALPEFRSVLRPQTRIESASMQQAE